MGGTKPTKRTNPAKLEVYGIGFTTLFHKSHATVSEPGAQADRFDGHLHLSAENVNRNQLVQIWIHLVFCLANLLRVSQLS